MTLFITGERMNFLTETGAGRWPIKTSIGVSAPCPMRDEPGGGSREKSVGGGSGKRACTRPGLLAL